MKKLILTIALIFQCFLSFSQEIKEDNDTDEIIDNLLGDDNLIDDLIKTTKNFQLLYFSADYNNKTYFLGRDVGIDQFNITPQVLYLHSNGIFAGLSSIYYSEFDPNWDYISATIGYGKSFGKSQKYRWSTSYARYFYSSGVDNPFTNALSAKIGVTNSSKKYGTDLSSTLLFGEDTSVQFTSTSFAEFQLTKGKNSELKFRPQLAILVGNQSYEVERTFGFNQQITIYDQFDDFGLLNLQLNLPLQFEVYDFDFELGYNFNFPSAIGNESDLKTTHFLNFSVGYTLDFE